MLQQDTDGRQPAALALFRSFGCQPVTDYKGNPYARYWFEKRLKLLDQVRLHQRFQPCTGAEKVPPTPLPLASRARLVRLGAAAEDVVLGVQELVAGLSQDFTLPTSDLVHSDLDLGNLIFRHGVFRAVVDIEAVGSGTAANA